MGRFGTRWGDPRGGLERVGEVRDGSGIPRRGSGGVRGLSGGPGGVGGASERSVTGLWTLGEVWDGLVDDR